MIVPLLVAKMTISHAAMTAMTTVVIINRTTAVEPGRNSTMKINATGKSTSRVLTYTKIAA